MAGRGSSPIDDCFQGGFVGCDFDFYGDLSGDLWTDWRRFNREFIPALGRGN